MLKKRGKSNQRIKNYLRNIEINKKREFVSEEKFISDETSLFQS